MSEELEWTTPRELSLDQTRSRIAHDMQAFCALALPEEVTIPFPHTYESLWWLIATQTEGIFRFAWGLPRGYAKTTLLKLLTAYLLIHGLRKFPLVVCATEPLAKAFLFDVVAILESDNIRQVYGKIKWTHDTAEYKMGHWEETGKLIILRVASSMSAVRGLNIAIHRPDLILMDDVQTKENAESPAERERLKKWIFATLLKASDRINAIYLYVGNMYNKHCILHLLKTSPEWTSFITGSILRDGSTLWPEFRSLAQIKATYKADRSVGEEDVFWSEEQNIPIDDILAGINFTGVEVEDYEGSERVGAYLTVDPAGSKMNSDNVAIAAHLVCDGVPYIVDGLAQQLDPTQTIELIISYCLAWDIKCVGIESVAYQSTLGHHLQKKLAELEIKDIKIVELYPGRQSKNKRIKSWTQQVQAGSYKVSSKSVLDLLSWESGIFDLMKTDNRDDFLDVCSMGSQMYTKYQPEWTEYWRASDSKSVVSDKDFFINCSYTDAA